MKTKILITLFVLIFNIGKSLDDKYIHVTDSLIEQADIYKQKGLYDLAIKNLMKARYISDSLNLNLQKTIIFDLLSNIFMLKKDYAKSLDYAFYFLKTSKEIKNNSSIAWAYARIADVMLETNDLKEAELNYKNSIKYFGDSDKVSTSQIISNLGLIYQKQKRYSEAESAFFESYEISKEIKYFTFQVYIEVELADLYRVQKKYNKADYFFNLALKNEKKADYIILTQNLFYNLYEFYKETGNNTKSLMYFEKYVLINDSLQSKNNNQNILDTETKFRTTEKEKEILFLNKESELQKSQIKKRNIILTLSCLVILFVFILFVIIYKSRKKQIISNQILYQKKKEIEHQKKDIIDSINYAKRIQDASLGNPNKIKDLYINSNILFQPKDILSGDFYWFCKKDNNFLFSVADCTGHGVPGAMMSMIGNNGLNEAVYNNNLKKPSEIIEHLSGYVNKNFTKTDTGLKDGMDIAFCNLNILTGELEYAGALNSLYICKSNGDFFDIKADRSYVGQIDSKYTNHKIQLEKGDCIYMMSDGYVDQFGGENNKKFKISKFRELIQKNYLLDIDQQMDILKNTIKNWIGNVEQTDDICLIGVKF